MDVDFQIKRNDTSPAIESHLQYYDDEADEWKTRDISGNNDVRFLMSRVGEDALTVDDNKAGNVTVTDAANGKVKYEWQDGDTDAAGSYQAEWEVTYSDGTIETYPNDGYLYVEIIEDKG